MRMRTVLSAGKRSRPGDGRPAGNQCQTRQKRVKDLKSGKAMIEDVRS